VKRRLHASFSTENGDTIDMGGKPSILGYAEQAPTATDIASFRRMRVIYGVGVGLACAGQIVRCAVYHPLPQMEPELTQLSMVMQVIGGAALAWLVIGVRQIVLSPLARRDVVTWVMVGVNAAPVFVGLLFRYT
jgi:hypothetical protein